MRDLRFLGFFVCLLIFILIGCHGIVNPRGEIEVTQDSEVFVSGEDEYDFGQIIVGQTSDEIIFTIENTGKAMLLLVGESKAISISDETAGFVIDQSQTVKTLSEHERTTFTVTFVPTEEIKASASIIIENNDPDENPFVLLLKAEGILNEINVRQGSTDIPSGSGHYDFGTIDLGESSQEIVFTVENLGTGELNLTGDPELITLAGQNAASFILDQTSMKSSLTEGEFTTFSIVCEPVSKGGIKAIITIDNDDIDENPYVINLIANGYSEPEIEVKDSQSNNIECGVSIWAFGNKHLNSISSETFTIKNLGNADLNLSGSPRIEISGDGASAFTISAKPIAKIPPDYSSYFSIEFKPTDIINYIATVSIANDDIDENPFTFQISGIGFDPEINVLDSDSNSIPSGTGNYDFNTLKLNHVQEEEFTIENLGNANLVLSGTPLIAITGPGSSAFTVSLIPANVIEPSMESKFKITFEPTAAQKYTATVSIVNNDPDEDPYVFTINGEGVSYTADFDFNGDGYDDIVVSAPSDTGNGSVYIFFGKSSFPTNPGVSDADVKISGEYGSFDFGTSVVPIGDFNGDGYDDVLISDPTFHGNSGNIYLFYGKPNSPSTVNAIDANVKYSAGGTESRFGASISAIGDFNKDGYDDFIVGAPNDTLDSNRTGLACIFLGKSSSPSSVNSHNADVMLFGLENTANFGNHVSKAGDFNKDGYDDVMITGTGVYPDNDTWTFMFFGCSSPTSKIYVAPYTVTFKSSNKISFIGNYVGDLNNDGFDDIMLTESIATYHRSFSIFYGRWNPPSENFSTSADVKIIGPSNNSNSFGDTCCKIGDVNNDGFDDFYITDTRYHPDLDANKGRVYIYYGKNNLPSTIQYTDANVVITGSNTKNYFGSGVSSIGDFNKDGVDDFVIGAFWYNDREGRAYMFYGKSNFASSLNATDANIQIAGAGHIEFGFSVGGGK